MKNFWKATLSMVLATSMITSSVPVSVQAAQSVQKGEKKAIEKIGAFDKTKMGNKKAEGKYAEGEAIVLYKGSTSQVKSFGERSNFGDGIEVVKSYDFFEQGNVSKKSNQSNRGIVVSLVKSEKYTTKELVKNLMNRDDVTYAEPNYIIKASATSDDTYSKYQWALENEGQNAGTEGLDINADTALLNKDGDSKEKVIALIDTGIDYTHEDLKDVVWNNPFAKSNKLKGQHGYDFINYDADPLDDNGHGSHCSGIMAGTSGNKVGIAGVTKSKNIKIMGLKILDSEGYGYGFEAVGAYNYIYQAQKLGVNVVAVNNSWGGYGEDGESQILKLLIDMVGEKGALSVCAAGNESADNDVDGFTIPCNIDSPYVISVAASNEKDEMASFSNYGAKAVDIAAPGANILSSVSYDSFNPGIYGNKEELCSVYEDFSKETAVTGSAIEGNQVLYNLGGDGDVSKVSVKLDTEDFFGEKEKNAKSLEWSIKGAKKDEIYHIYLPYTAKVSSTPVYDSMMLKVQAPELKTEGDYDLPTELYIADSTMDENGEYNEEKETLLGGTFAYGKNNYWDHISEKRSNKVTKEEQRVMAIQLYISVDGDYTIHLDDLGISQSNVKSERFGKYEYYNGTSMATPHITGAVAAVANAYPNQTVEQTKARVLGSARQVEGLRGKVSTAGVLDLSKVANPNLYVSEISLNKENNIEIKGSFLKDSTVKVNGTVVEQLGQTDNMIVIDGKKQLKKKLEIEVSKGDYRRTDTCFFSTGKKAEVVGMIDNFLYDGSVVADGEKLYYIDTEGCVYTSNFKTSEENSEMSDEDLPGVTGKARFEWNGIGEGFNVTEIFGKEYITVIDYKINKITDIIASSKKLWVMACLDLGYAEETALLSFDEKTGKWTKVSNIPEEFSNVLAPTLAAYEGQLYLIGGFDPETNEASKKVFYYNIEKKEWEAKTSMPEGRFGSKALQVGNKLVVTLGGTDKEECPSNYIFDGSTWTVSKAKLESNTKTGSIDGENVLSYYTAQIGLVNNGIVYTDCFVDGLGDTIKYDIQSDTFQALEYSMIDEMKKDVFYAVTIGDKLYSIYGDDPEYWVDEDFTLNSHTNDDTSFIDESGLATVASIPVESGCIKVEDKSTEGGSVLGVGNYLPGDIIELTPQVLFDELYFVKKFVVNGKTVQGNTYRCKASEKIEASVVTGAYPTSITVDSPVYEVEVGGTVQLKAEVYPENAEYKKIEWETDNANVAVVDQNGKVTVTSVNGGEEVTITAKVVGYSDYITETYTLEVKKKQNKKPIVKKVKVKKIKLTPSKKTVKAGAKFKINAVVSPANATNKKIVWSTSNKKYATVDKKGKVTTKKAGKGKVVTITAKAVDGSKVIKKLKVKIK